MERITEFSVGTAPTSIVTGSDGAIWFDDGKGNQIVRIDAEGKLLDRLHLVTEDTQRELVAGRVETAIVYTDYRARTVSKVTRTLQVTTYDLGSIAPSGLTLGADDRIWVAEMNKAVHRILLTDPLVIDTWPASPSNTIVRGLDDDLWFPDNITVARLTPSVGVQDFPVTGGYINDLCLGPDGAFWYTDVVLHQIGRIETDGTLSRTYDLTPGTKPFRIVGGADGALWFTEQSADKIGRITVEGKVDHYPIPTVNALPYGIAVGPDRNLWFTEAGSGKVGRLRLDSKVEP